VEPASPLPRAKARDSNPAYLLQRELVWWNDPASAKKETAERVPYDYSAQGLLKTLLAVSIYVEDRDGQGFPGDAPEIVLAFALCQMRRRPRFSAGKRGAKRSQPVSATVRTLLAERIKKSLAGTYLLASARSIIAEERSSKALLAKRQQDQRASESANAEPPFTDLAYWIEVRTPERQIIQEGNNRGFEVDTGRFSSIYRRRQPEDGDAPFIVTRAKARAL
jgi:hypothetical protein